MASGLAVSGIAASGVPGVWAAPEIEMNNLNGDLPRLPLTIYMRSGLSPEYLEQIRDISSEIELLQDIPESEKAAALKKADVVFGYLGEDDFKQSKKLKWVQSPSAGVEHYLYPVMVNSEVMLTNAKGCYGSPISEHVFSLLFSHTRRTAEQIKNMASGKWERPEGQIEMRNLTMGIIGFGGIGRETARRAKAMDMKVITADVMPFYEERYGNLADEIHLMEGGGFEHVLAHSDVIVSAAPHTDRSEGIFDAKAFETMKEGAYFINVSRGKLVQTDALLNKLNSGHLAGVGLDVTDPEPLPSDHPLWKMPNVVITAHNAARSQYHWGRMQQVFADNVKRYVKGFPLLNQVDKEAGF